MADYFSQTVIQQPIPISDMTALERLVLENMLQYDVIDDAIYFYAEDGPRDLIWLERAELETALKATTHHDTTLGTLIDASLRKGPPESTEIEVDLSAISWEYILQDIIKRSSTLAYVTIVTSWSCSKMRPDGFGGMAVMVTPTEIMENSTTAILERWIGAYEKASSDIKAIHNATNAGSAP